MTCFSLRWFTTYSCVDWCCLGGSVFFPEPGGRQFLTVLFTHVCSVPHNCRVSVLKQAKTALLSFPAEHVRRGASLLLGIE